DDIALRGLTAHEVLDGSRADAAASVVPDAGADRYDLVLVAVRSDQLAQAGSQLAGLTGSPAVLFFGNNPAASSRCLPRSPARSGSDSPASAA
ncbi:MAG TPA: hypothetical protein VED20_04930, partial [Streptosporangiaceae bacterium]|nr:hypothetical protein [Streptosporangiaceae bacterium]